eukprot:CAMPEP_0203774316 /NCGR_PEP_ID=MMETSP0099_2-20121227/5230_1 /ASSEMBLY_ACC=CAM_ASM_000209 /TAXON_ID=96639 /ORGANISM=" , Strain NY0313808BC1" /LENGTH=159 /DNA_ID=CAMNT_0050672413 /DNA_START=45 /DNA_END=524 /DNA_ORIENTATION=-
MEDMEGGYKNLVVEDEKPQEWDENHLRDGVRVIQITVGLALAYVLAYTASEACIEVFIAVLGLLVLPVLISYKRWLFIEISVENITPLELKRSGAAVGFLLGVAVMCIVGGVCYTYPGGVEYLGGLLIGGIVGCVLFLLNRTCSVVAVQIARNLLVYKN